VAVADGRRRVRDAVRLSTRLAPIGVGGALLSAVVARFSGWRPLLSLLLLVGSAIILAVIAWRARRALPSTDAVARRVDADATLGGELHSAHWFESRPDAGRDEWTAYHLEQAAERARAVAWNDLYPPVAATRVWMATGAMAVGVLALAIVLPARAVRAVSDADQLAATVAAAMPTLSPELQMQLEALMRGVKGGTLSPEELKAALENLKKMNALDPAMLQNLAEMAKAAAKEAADSKKVDPKDLARNEKKDGARDDDGRKEDTRWAQEEQASRTANAAANKASSKDQQAEGGEGEKSKDAKSEDAASMSIQIARESSSQSDASQAMMMDGGGGPNGDSSAGAGGKSGEKPGQAAATLLAQALKKELVEASADAAGDNINKEDLRRKTEAGKSAMGYTKAAATSFDKSRASAAPPVPEARRPLVQSYFVRKSGDRH
jgi:hypothetical protein